MEKKIQKCLTNDDDVMIDDFESDEESSLNINCNMVYVLPHEYDQVMEVEDSGEVDEAEMARHKHVCYYIMNNGTVEEQNAFFEHPDQSMKNHLKPLFIRGKVEGVGINNILVDGGEIVNLMPQFMLKRIGMFDTNIKPHNMVLSNY